MKEQVKAQVEKALSYICERDEEYGALVKNNSACRAAHIMLKRGGFNLQEMHANGSLRLVLSNLL